MAHSSQLVVRRLAFRRALHAWFRLERRKLPWRDDPSVYKTVVSEFMLQQTQVATVLPYFDRWLRALPDFAALAAASETRVLKLWEGLGYYSRARNLHRLARAVAPMPEPPQSSAAWLELPGVGPYTAAAIASIALGEPVAVVDGNVVRILARLTGERRRFRDGAEAARHFAAVAGQLVAGGEPGLHNEAMMELGATVCLRQKPSCATCPVSAFCVARASGTPERIPRFVPKPVERREVTRVWCEHAGRLLLRRAPAKAKRLAGLHELPEASDLSVHPGGESLLATKRRAITRFQITESIHRLNPSARLRQRIGRAPSLEWVPFTELDRLVLSGPHRRWIAEIMRTQAIARCDGAGPDAPKKRPSRVTGRTLAKINLD